MIQCECFVYHNVDQISSCVIKLLYIDDNFSAYRDISIPLGICDFEFSSIKTLKIALNSISPFKRKDKIIVKINSQTIIDILNNRQSKYDKESQDIITLFESYQNLIVMYYNSQTEDVLNLAKETTKTEKNFDSGTRYE